MVRKYWCACIYPIVCPCPALSYEDLLASRAAVLRGLADNTDRTDYSSENAHRQDRVGVGLSSVYGQFPDREVVHRELVITEGRKAVPCPQLQSTDHLDRLIVRLRLNVLGRLPGRTRRLWVSDC